MINAGMLYWIVPVCVALGYGLACFCIISGKQSDAEESLEIGESLIQRQVLAAKTIVAQDSDCGGVLCKNCPANIESPCTQLWNGGENCVPWFKQWLVDHRIDESK